jgi:hypothetical protein
VALRDTFLLPSELEDLNHRSQWLDWQKQALERCNAEKDHVVADLLAGRVTLFGAAARFRVLYEALPFTQPVDMSLFPGDTREEQLCWCVIGHAAKALEDQPVRQAAVVAKLEADLRQERARHGAIQLPALSAGWRLRH